MSENALQAEIERLGAENRQMRAELAQCRKAAEVTERLHDKLLAELDNIATAQPLWNGGVARPSAQFWSDFAKQLQADARAALTPSKTETTTKFVGPKGYKLISTEHHEVSCQSPQKCRWTNCNCPKREPATPQPSDDVR